MIGKSIANRPYMYLPLKGDTNDYSTNAQNPSNTGVATTTGEFGESNGAYDWGNNTDRLSWVSSVGNAVVNLINDKITILYNIYGVSLSSNTYKSILSQYRNTNPDRSFYIFNFNFTGNANTNRFTTINEAFAFSNVYTPENTYVANQWDFMAYTTKDNTTNLDVNIYKNGTLVDTDTLSKTDETDSSLELRLGAIATNNDFGDFGKMHNFRIYNTDLSAGALKILNNEKGRIRA